MTLVPELRLDRLRAFAAVAREGGFSRAARALGRTQSSVSQAVALLEDDVGDLLIVRDGRRTALTEAGRVLRDHAERVLAALADARALTPGKACPTEALVAATWPGERIDPTAARNRL
ncbi:MAG: LysR family transcriptional regulator, partial [Myxococcales bacterium]|nr:LysR family transcriptional regulator [Myxococcales bacterium]